MKKFNSDGISIFLGLTLIGEIDVPTGGSKDHYGGWDSVNDSPMVGRWRKRGGKVRAKKLPAHNRTKAMRQVTAERNTKYSVGNKFHSGVKHSEAARKKISENNGSLGSKWMILGRESKRIPADQVESHLNIGWRFGRVMR